MITDPATARPGAIQTVTSTEDSFQAENLWIARAAPHLLCIGGEDHSLRIPFLLALRKKGFRVTAAASGDPAPFARAGVEYHRFHFDRFVSPAADAAALKAIRKIVDFVQPQLIHCFDTKLNMLVPLALRHNRVVQTVRTINGMGWVYSSWSPMALGLRLAYRILQRLASQWTAAAIFQNRDDQSFFVRHRMLGRARHLLIPGSGIDIEGFGAAIRSGASPAELRAELGLGTSEIVLTVSRMTRQKGIPTLLKAAALIHEHRPDVRFLLVGPRESEGPWAVTQEELDRHAPYVIATGPRPDVPVILRLAHVFAFPTEYREGVPRALLEAALAGLPIVTTDLPGCRDVVRNGVTGLTVPAHAPKLLAERILDLLRDREAAFALGARASELVRREFGLEVVTERHAALYAELVNRSVQQTVNGVPREPELGSPV